MLWLVLFLFKFPSTASQSSILFGNYPGYNNLRFCAQQCLDDFGAASLAVRNNLGCSTNDCLCGHEQDAVNYVQTCASKQCSSESQDASSATSLLTAYCASYLGQSEGVAAPLQTQAAPSSIVFSNYPGYINLRFCAQQCLDDFGAAALAVRNYIGCTTNECLCVHESMAASYVQTCAGRQCSSESQDIYSATALLVGYCASYAGTTNAAALPAPSHPPVSISFGNYAGYSNLRSCAQQCLDDFGAAALAVRNYLGCGTSDCLCDHEADAVNYVSTCANTQCSSNSQDTFSATSLLVAYCASYRVATTAGVGLSPTQATSTPFLTEKTLTNTVPGIIPEDFPSLIK